MTASRFKPSLFPKRSAAVSARTTMGSMSNDRCFVERYVPTSARAAGAPPETTIRPILPEDAPALVEILAHPTVARWWGTFDEERVEKELIVGEPDLLTKRRLGLVEQLVDDRMVADVDAVALGQLARLGVGADVEAEHPGLGGQRERDVARAGVKQDADRGRRPRSGGLRARRGAEAQEEAQQQRTKHQSDSLPATLRR